MNMHTKVIFMHMAYQLVHTRALMVWIVTVL